MRFAESAEQSPVPDATGFSGVSEEPKLKQDAGTGDITEGSGDSQSWGRIFPDLPPRDGPRGCYFSR